MTHLFFAEETACEPGCCCCSLKESYEAFASKLSQLSEGITTAVKTFCVATYIFFGVYVAFVLAKKVIGGYGDHWQFSDRVSLTILSRDELQRSEATKDLIEVRINDPDRHATSAFYMDPREVTFEVNDLFVPKSPSGGGF